MNISHIKQNVVTRKVIPNLFGGKNGKIVICAKKVSSSDQIVEVNINVTEVWNVSVPKKPNSFLWVSPYYLECFSKLLKFAPMDRGHILHYSWPTGFRPNRWSLFSHLVFVYQHSQQSNDRLCLVGHLNSCLFLFCKLNFFLMFYIKSTRYTNLPWDVSYV